MPELNISGNTFAVAMLISLGLGLAGFNIPDTLVLIAVAGFSTWACHHMWRKYVATKGLHFPQLPRFRKGNVEKP